MKIHDISMTIYEEMPVYKNKEELKPSFSAISDFKTGDVHETRISIDLHTGTHLDAPFHMLEGGRTAEKFDLGQVITPCRVLDLTEIEEKIREEDLKEEQIKSGEFILFKTKNSFQEEFDLNFIYLDKKGAEYLVEVGVKGVGIDSLGIERGQPGHPTHKTILKNNLALIEGLRLKNVEKGIYTLMLAPLKIKGGDAAPLRAVLIEGLKIDDQ